MTTTNTAAPTVTTWQTLPAWTAAYGIDTNGQAWERVTGPRGDVSFYPLGTPASTWNPAGGNIDVIEVD